MTDITDHFPVFYVSSCHKQLMPNDSFICRWNYCYNNKLAFQRALSETDWSEMYMQCDNVQSAFSMFHSRYVDLFVKDFPKRKIKITYNNRKPWLTSALKHSIPKKNRLYASLNVFNVLTTNVIIKCIRIILVPCWNLPRKLTMQTC